MILFIVVNRETGEGWEEWFMDSLMCYLERFSVFRLYSCRRKSVTDTAAEELKIA